MHVHAFHIQRQKAMSFCELSHARLRDHTTAIKIGDDLKRWAEYQSINLGYMIGPNLDFWPVEK